MLIILAKGVIRPDRREAFIAAAREQIVETRKEPGCISHAVQVDCENPLRLVFLEQWADRAALLTHFAVPASRDFVRALQSLAAAATTIEIYDATKVDRL